MSRLLSALLLAPLVLASGAHAADVEGSLRVTGRMLVDSNAPRDFSDDQPGGDPSPDMAFSLLGAAEARVTGERLQLVGRYELGGRKYLSYADEDVLVQAAAVEGSTVLGTQLAVGVEGRGKDRRGGSRDYSDLGAGAFLEYAPEVRLALRVRAGAHRFVYRPDGRANFGGPEGGFLGRYRFNRRHALSVFGDYGARRYGVEARLPPGREGPSLGRRQDGALSAGAGYTYRGAWALGLTYTYQEVSSNSFGETVLRHRLSGSAGLRLPWRLTLLAQGAVGLSRYPDGIYLSPEIILVEEDEGQNSLSLKLARPVNEHMDVELSYGLYSTTLQRNELSYFRQVVGLGLTWRL
ncbi:hypothetical protein [Hyalangium rubrum]|uniref:DUF560 domain-containing protein n=1 Tax=Hyalangium rubrum TaxID=3103134 RepID=A0ABU5GZU2_9BACT|nr:hypothetical protein [Hyalangium sp. s54d21]MDY7226665.1 hypothetical protein [Hyalangium sp. s54d21]